MRGLAVDSRFGTRVIASEATGTIPFYPVRAAQPMTLYVVTAMGATGDRVQIWDANVSVAQFAAGRTTAGTSWFAQANISVVAAFTAAAGPTVLCATRTHTQIRVRTLSGSASANTVPDWPSTSSLARANVSPSILHWELWAGVAHSDHVAAAFSAQMAARFL